MARNATKLTALLAVWGIMARRSISLATGGEVATTYPVNTTMAICRAEAVTFSTATLRADPALKLSTRELEILGLLAKGNKIGEVAHALNISYKTVANMTSLLKQKLGAKNHSDLIRIAVEMGLG